MSEIYLALRTFICLVLVLLLKFSANAQLQANFTSDKNGGCSPVTINLTNTTTGASANAVYKWDFGNGNSSTLQNAAATYVPEQTYPITLTVTDSSKTSSITKQVDVYKRPTVDFSFDVKKGCLPLPVNFVASATAGDGSLANYFWDFGDGNTLQTTAPQIQHIYNLSQQTSVGLTVTNSYGCYTSIEKNAVQVLEGIQPIFTVKDTFLCNISDPVSFINASTGPGTLNYMWDFGDGQGSGNMNPTHVYNKKGVYKIKLTVSNNEGCSSTGSHINVINVANFTPGFEIPQPICLNSNIAFKDTSTVGGTNQQWFVDGMLIPAAYYDTAFHFLFGTPGEHSIQLLASYGNCKVADTQKVMVNNLPNLQPFIIDVPQYCVLPVTFHFSDTTKAAVAWDWSLDAIGSNYVFATGQASSYQVLYPLQSGLFLTVKNAVGCTASERQYVNIDQIYGGIQEISRSGCDSITIGFKADRSSDSIINYLWKFGDGGTSSQLAKPTHTYTKTGNYIVTLDYVTDKGCTGTYSYSYVTITKKPSADFNAPSGTTVCGNSNAQFLNNSTGDYWTPMWKIASYGSDSFELVGFNFQEQMIRFRDTGIYSVQMILLSTEGAACNDTMTKINFVKVLPAIPKINGYLNTCDGARGMVRFTESSINPTSWTWDFGDSTSLLTYNSKQDTILHNYAYTGNYKVRLTVQNGACSLSDSIYIAVLLKQHPLLSLPTSQVCTNGGIKFWLGNYELNTDPHFIDAFDWDGNLISKFEYSDGTTFTGQYSRPDSLGYSNPWYTVLTAMLSNFKPFETSFRAITTSAYFGCSDTSNYVPVKINGPRADFTITSNPCFEYPVLFQDISKADSAFPVKLWHWDFGDGSSDTLTAGGMDSHTYGSPGQYNIQLKVTDDNGCSDTISHLVNNSGPKAAFTYYPVNVTPNTPVIFTNNTETFNSINIGYQWFFGDGTTSGGFAPSHSYTATGTYTVKLITTNPVTQCKDTATQVIIVKLINTEFAFTKSYVSTSTCPPVIVHFTNTSSNAQSVSWNFGDGSIADDQNNPSHTYYTPGVYRVTMYGFGYNGTRDTTVDSIVVRAPYATLKADKLFGCSSQTITLNAAVTNASHITWDFADGTIKQTQDTFAVHQYAAPGLYNPSLILLDSGGCYLTAKLADTIIIDALDISLPHNKHYCDTASVLLDPTIKSVAAESFNQSLTYHWNFGTGKPADTADIVKPIFNYNYPGSYLVSLLVTSPYGCTKQATDSIIITAGSTASINGPSDICKGVNAQFSGQATNNVSAIVWHWDFNHSITSTLQNPLPIAFADTGTFNILLVVINNGCADTTLKQLSVHDNPIIHATPQQTAVCLGNSVNLSAQGGTTYAWSPAASLNYGNVATPVATPLLTTKYTVKVTNGYGCINTDSLTVAVVRPFTLQVSGDIEACAGESVQVNANGAANYSWIIATAGLSNTQINNPIATPASNMLYTVVGYDAAHCFTDTATVRISINPLPAVNPQPDVETLAGKPVQLQAAGSADILSWSWAPSDYLNCSNCAAPVSTPFNPVTYIATAKTAKGCTASDTILVKLTCAISNVYVPAVFSPNNDGRNDVFTILGTGVSNIRKLLIYNRYGEIVFEKRNSRVGDHAAGWDGMIKGTPATAGTYVYVAELTCVTGEVFPLNGTVVLLR